MTREYLKAQIDTYLSTLDNKQCTDSGATERGDAEYALAAFLEWLYPTPKLSLPVFANGTQVIGANGATIATCADRDAARLLADTLNKGTP